MKNYNSICGYSIGRLKPHLFLIPRDTNDITVNLSTLTFTLNTEAKRLNVHQIEFSHNQSNFSKFQFATNLSIILGESKENLDVIDEMRNNDYIIIVEDYYNKKYLLNIDFKYKIEYEHIFDDEMNYSEINITTTSNYPVLESNEQISYSDLNDEKQSYLNGGIKKLKLINRDKVVIDEDGKMTYNQEDLFAIEFISANANIGYNGSYYTNNIAFQIGCDNHYAYHLIEHPNNSYVGIIETNNGLFYIIGDNGMIGTYAMTIEDDFNSISISLNGYSNNNMISTKESTPYTTEWKYYTDLCDGYDLYEYESLQYTEDGINWNNVQPLQTRKGKLIEENSLQCISSDDDDEDDDEDVKVITATYKGNGSNEVYLYTAILPIKQPNLITEIDGQIITNSISYIFNDEEIHTVKFYNIDTIPMHTFNGCDLTEIVIEGVERIDYQAFRGCKYLTKIIISNDIATLGENIFVGCTNLKSVTIDGGDIIYDDTFQGCDNLKTIYLNVEEIEPNAFRNGVYNYNRFQLSSVTLGNRIISIGNNAFYSQDEFTSLKILNDNTCVMGDESFRYCHSLQDIYFKGEISFVDSYAPFQDCESLSKIVFDTMNYPKINGILDNQIFPSNSFGDLYVPKITNRWVEFRDEILPNWSLKPLDNTTNIDMFIL